MLSVIDSLNETRPAFSSHSHSSLYTNLDIKYDQRSRTLWNFISADSTAYFSTSQLIDIRSVQGLIESDSTTALTLTGENPIRTVVFGSRYPGTFSLGGDLQLFRDLIAANDREALRRYAFMATDAVYHHAYNERGILTFSLVQGTAMGGGFEAALAGNILVAERGCKMGFPEVLFGLFPGMGAYTLLRRRVSSSTAKRIIMTARNFSAEELFDIGVVDHLAEPGNGEDEVKSIISRESNLPGAQAFRRAVSKADRVDPDEMRIIADEWVETALRLSRLQLRRIERLIQLQRKQSPSSGPTVAYIQKPR